MYLFKVNILVSLFVGFMFNFHFLIQVVISFNEDCSFWIDDFIEQSCVRIVVSSTNIASFESGGTGDVMTINIIIKRVGPRTDLWGTSPLIFLN